MKKRVWMLIMVAVLVTGCGKTDEAVAGDETAANAGTTINDEAEGETTSNGEAATENETASGENTAEDAGIYTFSLDEKSNGIEIRYIEASQQYEIQDSEQVAVFRTDRGIQPVSAAKLDIDSDGEDEYVIIACAGRGTGVYVTDLLVVKEGNETPIAYLSNEEITEQLEARTEITYDDDWDSVTLYYDSESLTSVYLEKFLEEREVTYYDMALGDIIEIENDGDRYWVTAAMGVVVKEWATPQYDCSIHLSAPLNYQQENQTFTIGDITAKAVDDTQTEEIKAAEPIAEFYADITHNGCRDKLVISAPEGKSWDEVLSGVVEGELRVYWGYVDTAGEMRYSDESILERYFSPTHAANGQMFLTTVDGKDYLVETDFWAGQERYTYGYKVYFTDCEYDYVMESAHEEYSGEPGDTSAFFDQLDAWINDSSILLYAADIDHDPDLLYSTADHIINPKEYMTDKRNFTW